MPFDKPQRSGTKWVLPKQFGDLHRTPDGKVVKYKSRASAERAARAMTAKENEDYG